MTGLRETDVELLLVLEPTGFQSGEARFLDGGWPECYFERTFASLKENPIAYEPLPHSNPVRSLSEVE